MVDSENSPWPAKCRCGFVAENREEAEAHAILQHPEALTETGKKVNEIL